MLHPELFINIIDAYAKVLDNLKKHALGWHDPDYLKSIVTTGQKEYGIADVGDGTIPWLGLVNKGLFDIEHPHWGG